jgi:hypothetical protein
LFFEDGKYAQDAFEEQPRMIAAFGGMAHAKKSHHAKPRKQQPVLWTYVRKEKFTASAPRLQS